MSIRDFIKAHIDPNFSAADDLPFPVAEKCFSQGDVLTTYGQQGDKAYFLTEGLVQTTILKDGEEKIFEFFVPPAFLCTYTALFCPDPSDVEITCLSPCKMEMIRRDDMVLAYEHSLLANQLGRFVSDQVNVMRAKRAKDLLVKSAKERYLNLMEKDPKLIRLLPVNKIAKYLGIHPESLSRIRKEIIS